MIMMEMWSKKQAQDMDELIGDLMELGRAYDKLASKVDRLGRDFTMMKATLEDLKDRQAVSTIKHRWRKVTDDNN